MSDASGAPEVLNTAPEQSASLSSSPALEPEPQAEEPKPEPQAEESEPAVLSADVPATAGSKSQFNPDYSAPIRRGPQIYTTQPGDDLASIAEKFDVVGGADALYALNDTSIGESPNILRPGIALNIP